MAKRTERDLLKMPTERELRRAIREDKRDMERYEKASPEERQRMIEKNHQRMRKKYGDDYLF